MKSFYSKLAGLLTVLALILSFSGIAMSQTETGTVVGVVTDPSGAVVPNAKVTLKSIGTGAERSNVTDDNGAYIFTNVNPAVYSVTVEAGGFAKVERRVQVTVGSKVTQDVALTIGAAQTIVEITAEAGVTVNTETQTLGSVIDSKKILELPTLTRNPYDLVSTAGNVSSADPSGRGVGVAINGQRAASTSILLDGATNSDEFTAVVGQSIPLDAVQEFSVITNNFTAEFGRASGGIVNAITKSGTNEYHGTAYLFGRYSALASNTFDNNANGIDKPVFTRNQFGYSVGGPVIKDKLFFFQSTEWTRVRSSAPTIALIPTAQLIAAANTRTQDFFSAFGARKSGLQTLGTLTRQDIANSSTGDPCTAGSLCDTTLAMNFPMYDRITYSVPSNAGGGDPQNSYSLVGRADWVINEKTSLYFRYALEDQFFLSGSNADSPYQGFDTGAVAFNNNALISLTRTWNPRLVTQSKIVFNRLNQSQPLGDLPNTPTLFLRTSATRLAGDLVGLPGYLPFNPGTAIPFGGPQNFGQVYQDISYSKGAHQLRFGGSYVYIQDNRTFGAFANPAATLGANIQQAHDNFLLGQLQRFESAIDPQGKAPCVNQAVPDPTCIVNLPVGQPSFTRSNRYHELGLYFQDAWKVMPRLTVNLGLRWEYYGVQHNKDPKLDSNFFDAGGTSQFLAIRNGALATSPNSPVGGLWKKDWNNFAPRVGFAWDVFGNGKTSLRGGYGVGYERNFGNVTFNVIQNPPNYAVIALVAGADVPTIDLSTSLAGPLAGTTGSKALPRTSLRNVNSNIANAYAHFWSLSVDREVWKRIFASVEYSGSKGRQLYSLEDPNRPGTGNVFLGDACVPGSCSSRLNGQFAALNRRGNKGESIHNALNLKVTGNNIANQGLTLTFNYTWAHTIDNISSTFSESFNNFNLGLLDPFNPGLDRGSADFDQRHRVSISSIWEIPYAKNTTGVLKYILDGWQITPIFTATTGAPFSIFDCDGAQFSVCPRLFATVGASLPRTGPDNPPASSGTPNFFDYINLNGLIDQSFANPITGNTEFGPFPANMTGRNFFRGPGQWNLDVGINKTTKITERFKLQYRAEFFNAFNHSNLFVVGSGAVVPGPIQAQRGEREGFIGERRNIQMALKLIF